MSLAERVACDRCNARVVRTADRRHPENAVPFWGNDDNGQARRSPIWVCGSCWRWLSRQFADQERDDDVY